MASTKTGSRLRILVPRLEFELRGTITRHLRKEGMDVLPSVPSGRSLVRVLEAERPDAVVLDTEVVRKAGADSIAAIRAATPGTKIVLITKGQATAKAFALGADANVKAGAEPGAISSLIVNLCGEPTITLPE
ncbi:MAG: response regulator, partial [Actinomycetota bacterium]